MVKENSFLLALSFSLLGHASLFVFRSSPVSPAQLLRPQTEEAEVSYFGIREVPQWGGLVQEKSAPESEAQVPQPTPAPVSTPAPAAPFAQNRVPPPEPYRMPKPVQSPLARQGVIVGKATVAKEETFYHEMTRRLQDPVFATYYETIRDKIRRAAKKRYGGKSSAGEVPLGFILFSTGRLKEVNVLEAKQKVSVALGTVAVQSVVEASPFPPFPAHLGREQLSFVVVLTFEPKP